LGLPPKTYLGQLTPIPKLPSTTCACVHVCVWRQCARDNNKRLTNRGHRWDASARHSPVLCKHHTSHCPTRLCWARRMLPLLTFVGSQLHPTHPFVCHKHTTECTYLVYVEVTCHSEQCEGLVLRQVPRGHKPIACVFKHACSNSTRAH
jgi:hypothetical protein